MKKMRLRKLISLPTLWQNVGAKNEMIDINNNQYCRNMELNRKESVSFHMSQYVLMSIARFLSRFSPSLKGASAIVQQVLSVEA